MSLDADLEEFVQDHRPQRACGGFRDMFRPVFPSRGAAFRAFDSVGPQRIRSHRRRQASARSPGEYPEGSARLPPAILTEVPMRRMGLSKLELVINLKTAKALGLTISPAGSAVRTR